MKTANPIKASRRAKSDANKRAHAERIARERPDLPRSPATDPLDEEPMRPALMPIPCSVEGGEAELTAAATQAIRAAILDHYPVSDIARATGIRVTVLRRLIKKVPTLSDAQAEAKADEEGLLRDALMRKALAGDTIAALFLLKSRHGYVEAGKAQGKGEPAQGGVLLVPAAVPLDEWEAACARQQAPHRQRATEEHLLPGEIRTSTDQGHGVVMQKTSKADLPRKR